MEVYPRDQNAAGGAMKPSLKLLGPAGEELGQIDGEENRTWIERDALGREIASWRESGPRYASLQTPNPASSIVYNLAGQVWKNWDANSTRVTRTSRYDEAGRLVYVTTDPATGEGIEYVFGPGDLGRVTEVREVTYPAGVATAKWIARNHYDYPFSAADPGYSFVAGKLSWTENAETAIAYGYDDAGRVWRRDQWFAKLDPTMSDLGKRFTVSSTYGTDGRVLDSRVVNPYSATAEYQYFVDYDSAGRPVALSGKLASAGNLTKVYEVVPSQGPSNGYGGYDALGRVPVMRTDDGRVVSARRYNGYSGALERECKRFGSELACGAVTAETFTPQPLDVAHPEKEIYRTDLVAAKYRGPKLAEYEDAKTATRYTNTYLPNGRLQSSQALPLGAVGSLTQDWLETFFFSGIGNLDRVQAQRNTAAGNARPDHWETEQYTPESPAPGQALDRVSSVVSRLSSTSGGAPVTGLAAATPGTTSLSYDLLGHLTKVTRSQGESESLVYAPGGELLYRQVGERYTFYMGEYATVTARGLPGCGASCTPQASTVEVDAHVVFAGTRIASVKPSRTLYYYRTRLGTVVATSLGGGVPGAAYRYTPYGEVELSDETDVTRSELGYTNALRLTGSLLYLKARVYDAEARVFLQADTVDRLRYAYVAGDPVNASDPSGLLPILYIVNGMHIYVEGSEQGGQTQFGRDDQPNARFRFAAAAAPAKTPEGQMEKEGEKKKLALGNEQEKAEKDSRGSVAEFEKLDASLTEKANARAQLIPFAQALSKAARRGDITDAAGLASMAALAAPGRDATTFVEDLGTILGGTNRSNLWDRNNSHQPVVEFGQTGFRPEFQEPGFGDANNQVRHFMGFVVAGYYAGYAVPTFVNFSREICCGPTATMADFRLGQQGIALGRALRSGDVPVVSVAGWIHDKLTVP